MHDNTTFSLIPVDATHQSQIEVRRTRSTAPRVPAQARSNAMVSAILEAACCIALERGLRKLTIRSVATRAGCGVGSVYDYFRSREDLIAKTSARLANTEGAHAATLTKSEALTSLGAADTAVNFLLALGEGAHVERIAQLLDGIARARGVVYEPVYWATVAQTLVSSVTDDEVSRRRAREWLASMLDVARGA